MHKLKTELEKGPPDGFMPFVNEAPCVTHMKGVDGPYQVRINEPQLHVRRPSWDVIRTAPLPCSIIKFYPSDVQIMIMTS